MSSTVKDLFDHWKYGFGSYKGKVVWKLLLRLVYGMSGWKGIVGFQIIKGNASVQLCTWFFFFIKFHNGQPSARNLKHILWQKFLDTGDLFLKMKLSCGGIGGVIWDHLGIIIRTYSGSADVTNDNEVQILWMLLGCKEFKVINDFKAMIKGDTFLVQLFNGDRVLCIIICT